MNTTKKTAVGAAIPATKAEKEKLYTDIIPSDGEKIKRKKEVYKSRVYTERPEYADLPSPEKFDAIQGIIITRLMQHPNAICSYSGGADSDILIDLIERTRKIFAKLAPVKYVFFNTGLEMKATKDHVKATAEKYGVEIEECRPKIGIVQAVKMCGVPFMSKAFSEGLGELMKKQIPLDIVEQYKNSTDKCSKYEEFKKKYPKSTCALKFLLNCDSKGNIGKNNQFNISSEKYFLDFLKQNPPDFTVSKKCCDYCKKEPAHRIENGYEMKITGEREAEGGVRTSGKVLEANETKCFYYHSNIFYFRPLYYVTDKGKTWYKEHYGIRYSDAYEVYGLTRTGCCGCPISYKAVDDLEKIRPYEPNVVKAAFSLFGKSYEYRKKYNEYKARRMAEVKQ